MINAGGYLANILMHQFTEQIWPDGRYVRITTDARIIDAKATRSSVLLLALRTIFTALHLGPLWDFLGRLLPMI